MEKAAKSPLRIRAEDIQACEVERLYPGILRHFEKAGLVEITDKH